jgi:hypothetical protein
LHRSYGQAVWIHRRRLEPRKTADKTWLRDEGDTRMSIITSALPILFSPSLRLSVPRNRSLLLSRSRQLSLRDPGRLSATSALSTLPPLTVTIMRVPLFFTISYLSTAVWARGYQGCLERVLLFQAYEIDALNDLDD